MDTLTHGLSGALVARLWPAPAAGAPSRRARTAVGFAAALFPDVDFALRFVDPVVYLNHHRAETHSLVLLPLWALLIAGGAWLVLGRRYRVTALLPFCAAGLAVHIAGDLMTAYGTRAFAPLAALAPAPGWVLVIDPWLTALLAAGVVASLRWPHPGVAAAGLGAVTAFVFFQAGLNAMAADIGERHAAALGWPHARVRALAQPLSPFNRAIIIERGTEYRRARVNLWRDAPASVAGDAPLLLRLHGRYRPAQTPDWEAFSLLPGDPRARAVAADAWASPALAPFRAFAHHPVFYRQDVRRDGTVCTWFTDLRYWYEPLPPPFRYGGCRPGGAGAWRLDHLPMRLGGLPYP